MLNVRLKWFCQCTICFSFEECRSHVHGGHVPTIGNADLTDDTGDQVIGRWGVGLLEVHDSDLRVPAHHEACLTLQLIVVVVGVLEYDLGLEGFTCWAALRTISRDLKLAIWSSMATPHSTLSHWPRACSTEVGSGGKATGVVVAEVGRELIGLVDGILLIGFLRSDPVEW